MGIVIVRVTEDVEGSYRKLTQGQERQYDLGPNAHYLVFGSLLISELCFFFA
jgi:hypothetical protein